MACGRVDAERLLLARHPRVGPETLRAVPGEMEELYTAADVFRSYPDYEAPGALIEAARRVIRPPDRE